MGDITEEEAQSHPDRHKLSQALGSNPELPVVSIKQGACHSDTTFLLATDGLAFWHEPEQLTRIISGASCEKEAVSNLIQKSLDAGGHNKLGVVCFELHWGSPPPLSENYYKRIRMKLTKKDRKILDNFISLFSDSAEGWTVNELKGYMFGISIIPDVVLPSEWVEQLQMGYDLEYSSEKQAREIHECFFKMYNYHVAEFNSGKICFPYKQNQISEENLVEVTQWINGFVSGLELREEYWLGEVILPGINSEMAEEISFVYFMVSALVYQEDMHELLEMISEEELERLDHFGPESEGIDREMKLFAACLGMVEENVNTLIKFAQKLDKNKKQSSQMPMFSEAPVRQEKVGRNQPCPCGSGKKYKKCCLNKTAELPENVIPVDFSKGKVLSKKPKREDCTHVYQLKIGLKRAKPPIWRRVQVPGNYTLDMLHDIIQIVMGWTDTHLHSFEIDKVFYESADDADDFSWNDDFISKRDEASVTLQNVLGNWISRFHYVYDFGDDWMHQIDVEKVIPAEEAESYPVLLTGRKACPPEDCGGIYGYMQLLEDLNDPESDYYNEVKNIYGDIDPTRFDKNDVTEIQAILLNYFK